MAAGQGFKTFVTGEVLTAADTNGYLMQGVNVFASAAARSAAITSPQEGQMSYLKDTNSTEYYDGASWVAVGAAGGGMTLISTTTLSGASVTLSSIPQTYNQLKIYVTAATNNTADGKLTFKPNDGTNGRWSGTDFNAVYNGTGSVIQPAANISRTNADNGFCFTYDNYTAAGYTNVFHLDGYYYDGGNPRGINIAGTTVAGPVTSFVLANTGGTFSGGTIKLYGVK
jgi:hypothetical protein